MWLKKFGNTYSNDYADHVCWPYMCLPRGAWETHRIDQSSLFNGLARMLMSEWGSEFRT